MNKNKDLKMYYEKSYNLRTSDFDGRDCIKVSSCLDFFQEIAGEHAIKIGTGYKTFINENKIWILVRQKITFLKSLKPNTKIKVLTWPKRQNRLYFNRDYKILDENGDIAVLGSAVWVVCDFQTRRLVRVNSDLYNSSNYFDEDVYDSPIEKLKFKTLENEDDPFIHRVLNGHLDHNGHMNNRFYAEIPLNMMDLSLNKCLKEFTIEFVHESKLYDDIYSYKFEEDDKTYFYGYVNGKISYRAKAEYEVKK